jgi:RNA polymerase sigma-70 factor (ECF subfamily)
MPALAATLALREEIGDNTLSRLFGARFFMTEDETRRPPLEPADKAALERLLERARSGDAGAQEALYGMYKARVFGLACRYTYDPVAAEDLLQDVFIRVFTHLGDVRDVATMSAWVYRIALNTCYSYLRSKKLRSRTMIPLSAIEGGPGEAVYDAHETELRKPIEEALRDLPARLRSVFVLHDVDGFKHGEISRILGCSVGTSKSQLFKARMRIRERLKGKGVL